MLSLFIILLTMNHKIKTTLIQLLSKKLWRVIMVKRALKPVLHTRHVDMTYDHSSSEK